MRRTSMLYFYETPFDTPFFTIVTYKCILSSLNRCQHCSHCEISSTRKKKKTKVEWSSFERAYLNCSDRESGWDSDMCAHALTCSAREREWERDSHFLLPIILFHYDGGPIRIMAKWKCEQRRLKIVLWLWMIEGDPGAKSVTVLGGRKGWGS